MRTGVLLVAAVALGGAALAAAAIGDGRSAAPHAACATKRLPPAAPAGEVVLYGHARSLRQTGGVYRLRFDPALWLGGETANQAARADGVIEPGDTVPNDYYVREEGHRLLTYRVPRGTRVTVITSGTGGLCSTRIPVAELAQIVAGRNPRGRRLYVPGNRLGFWLRARVDTVRSLDQQYQPYASQRDAAGNAQVSGQPRSLHSGPMDVLVLIDKLDDLVHNAKPVPLTDQVRIDREEIYEILDQMRATIPEEIKQARWIVKERQEMLAEAKREVDRMLGEAREQAAREASQTEIVRLAEQQAQEIVEDARRQARETRLEMEDWADGILSTLEVNLDRFLTRRQAWPRAVARALPRERRSGRACRDRRQRRRPAIPRATASSSPAHASDGRVDTFLAIASKRDQKRYADRPIPDDVVRRMLDAARLSGSSKNSQKWEFVLARTPEARERLAGVVYEPRNVLGASLAVAIVGRRNFDTGRAAQNLMVAAWNDGVASSPNGIADQDAATELLGGETAIVISLGYPARPRNPQARPAEEWSARATRKPLDQLTREL